MLEFMHVFVIYLTNENIFNRVFVSKEIKKIANLITLHCLCLKKYTLNLNKLFLLENAQILHRNMRITVPK